MSALAVPQAAIRKLPKKWERVLQALATGRSYNRFEAERELHDHCLPSTVADLQKRGIRVERRTERVPGFQGIPTECVRYWLDPVEQDAARVLLDLRGS